MGCMPHPAVLIPSVFDLRISDLFKGRLFSRSSGKSPYWEPKRCAPQLRRSQMRGKTTKDQIEIEWQYENENNIGTDDHDKCAPGRAGQSGGFFCAELEWHTILHKRGGQDRSQDLFLTGCA